MFSEDLENENSYFTDALNTILLYSVTNDLWYTCPCRHCKLGVVRH